jgi:hypothetical protein
VGAQAGRHRPLPHRGGAPIPYQMLNNYYTNQLQTAHIMVEQ